MSACNECDGTGSWFDASHSADRICKTCKGTGSMTPKSATTPTANRLAEITIYYERLLDEQIDASGEG